MSRDKSVQCHWLNAKVSFGKFATYTLKLSEINFRKENFRKFLGVRPPLHSHEPNLYAMENQLLDE
jgi:hypothetical protein